MSVSVSHGVTISMNPIPNFDKISEAEAKNIVYNQIVPNCESRGVKLSKYGNHVGNGSLCSVEQYDEDKKGENLFNIKRIQQAFSDLDKIVKPLSQYKVGSYGLKHTVEKFQKEGYICNGDLIVAMLVKGYGARFGKTNESLEVNCMFKAKVLVNVQ